MIYVGAIFGGREAMSSKIGSAISKIKRLAGGCEMDDSGSLDIVFHVPGTLLSPDYDGVRTGTFSRKKPLLQIQSAVPQDLNDEDEVTEVARSLLPLLRQAVRVAQPVFDRAHIPYPQDEYEDLIDGIEKGLSSN